MKVKRFMLAAVGSLSLLVAASAASADTIEATTSGTFGSPATSSVSQNGVTISFTPASLSTDSPITGINATPFGTFDVSGVSGTSASFNSLFTLTITQYDPSSDSGTIGGTVTGTVVYFSNSLLLTVTGGSLTLAGSSTISPVTYTLYGGNIGSNVGSASSFNSTMYGTIDFTTLSPAPAVPLPASVFEGSALLGGLFLLKARHRKRSA